MVYLVHQANARHGIINEDPLGLDKIYLQAKRYAKSNTIGRPMIQQFAGALAGKGASKGVFITTSSFATPAIAFSKQVPQRIILIDGEELAKLMTVRFRVENGRNQAH